MLLKRTVTGAAVKLLLIAPIACVAPQPEHYMLRSEYYRAIEENNRRHEAEKDALRERIANLRSDLAREEGRRLQVENEWKIASERSQELEGSLSKNAAAAEESARAARREMEALLLSTERMEKELATAQETLQRYKIEEGRSVVLLDDVEFAANASALEPGMKEKLRSKAGELNEATQLSVIGYTDDVEARGRKLPSIWALSAARAAAVVDFLRNDAGVVEPEMTIVARGDLEPKSLETTVQGRRLNRRVEIIAIYR